VFTTVVVGADDSKTARRAIESAARFALLSGGTLHLVTAYGPKSQRESTLSEEFKYLSSEAEGQALIEGLAEGARALGVEPVLHLSKGDPADVIIGVADKVNADLIVVGNAGMKGVRRLLGSVPNSVAHGANCSVAIINTE
jgi:nucleotide-binding universal stress UspA family protein